ncbi:MAG: type II toxin-antitoxin system HicA family toxin [Propylenella sp.]
MTDFTPKVRKELTNAGWKFQRYGKGDHERWVNPATGAKVTVDANVRGRQTATEFS